MLNSRQVFVSHRLLEVPTNVDIHGMQGRILYIVQQTTISKYRRVRSIIKNLLFYYRTL